MLDTAALHSALIQQRTREKRRWRYLLLFIVLIALSLLLDVATGPSLLPLRDVVTTLLSPPVPTA